MQCLNKLIRSISVSVLLLNVTVYLDTFSFASRSQPYEKPNCNRNQGELEMRALREKIEVLEQAQAERLSGEEEKPQSPLSAEEQNRKDLKNAARGAAIGGLAGAGIWGAGALYVNHVGTAVTAATCPALGVVVALSAAGGALYGYAASE